MKTKLVSTLLILTGIVILFFPKLSELYYDYQQQKLVREWQSTMENIHNGDEPAQAIQAATNTSGDVHDGDVQQEGAKESQETELDFSSYPGMEGILMIEKINLKLPILHGATDKNMKTTVASIANTGKAGEIGNYAIAGHRNYTYGRNFNRLDELEQSDTIIVDSGEGQFEYTVTEKLYVKPEEVWVLEANNVDREITLITCHPMENPTHRLIIKGKVIDGQKNVE
ncbi:class D sortase [Brevibacillus ruminantium]|uniref:Class D sortase n=1 Tax=Brevibacillus ruminantium TaxID=2950604 RepID=A0ABY4WL77_9BACL|nr:class D sortase [Brevibacillus ruminantium]USG66610.1 class D sortase [Brevibacillus ruminantium]